METTVAQCRVLKVLSKCSKYKKPIVSADISRSRLARKKLSLENRAFVFSTIYQRRHALMASNGFWEAEKAKQSFKRACGERMKICIKPIIWGWNWYLQRGSELRNWILSYFHFYERPTTTFEWRKTQRLCESLQTALVIFFRQRSPVTRVWKQEYFFLNDLTVRNFRFEFTLR